MDRRRARHILVVIATVVATLAGLVVAVSAPARARVAAPVEVAVMTQNIFYGGDDYDLVTGDFCAVPDGCPRALQRLAHIIAVSGADVVGVQEAERNTALLADMLGWHASPQAHVISRFPILDPPGSKGLYTFVEPVPGRVIAVANTHLPSTPYGPYLVRDGKTQRQVLALERSLRLPAVQPVLQVLTSLARRGIPVFLTGDFNSPSHLDWTPAVAAVRPEVRYPVAWPVSQALAAAGLSDSYRDAHPDPVATPGFTWTPGGPETDPHEVFDRIDWVLHGGPSTTLSSRLVGERGAPDVDLAFAPPYPTDHRGVVSTFALTPAPAPLVASPATRRITIGDPLTVRFHGRGVGGEKVVLGRAMADGSLLIAASATTGTTSPADGTVTLPTRRLEPGRWVLAMTDGRTVFGASAIWAYRTRDTATVTTGAASYGVGDPITVRWSGAPGENLDWVGLYRCRSTCGGPGDYLVYRYTATDVFGSVTFDADGFQGEGAVSWPLPAGTYVARVLVDDSYVVVGESQRFRIVATSAAGTTT